MVRSIGSNERRELLDVVRNVRWRWRMRQVLRGGLLTVGSALLAVAVVVFALNRWTGSPGAATGFTILLYLGVAFVAIRFLVRPLFQRVTDQQVAHYLEEHEPELRMEIVTAVGAIESERQGTLDTREANGILQGLVRSAVRRARSVEGGLRVDRRPLRRLSWSSVALAFVLAFFFLADPFGLRTALPGALRPWTQVQAAPPLAVQVLPGDTVVPRGSEIWVTARLFGFDVEPVEIAFKGEVETQWTRSMMARVDEDPADAPDAEGGAPARPPTFDYLVFRVDEPIEYFAESDGIRSGTYRVDVVDLPYVSQLELEIHYPAYTGRDPELVENGGDLVVLPGTTVRVRAHPTIPVPAGQIVLEGLGNVALALREDGVLTGEFRVTQPGFYRIELEDDEGVTHQGSPDHLIDVIDDLPPIVAIREPGRDTRATMVEEVYIETRASDDFGLARLEIVYAVNGGEEQTIALLDGTGELLRDASAGHTLFLDEFGLEPGDLIAYYARGLDNGPNAEERETLTDIYFVTIRPFQQDFRQADQGGGGGGMGAAGAEGQFSQRQRDIVAATFNVGRDWRAVSPELQAEDVATIAQAQVALREEVEGFLAELRPRLARAPEDMRQVAEELPQAVAAMDAAAAELREQRTVEALPPEQTALQHLLRAEAVFREIQLQQQQQGGGGGGASGQEMRDDLADFFDLEMDRMRNQYEELQRGQQEQQQQQMEAALDRLRELARRQQQEAERLQRAAQEQMQGSSAGGQSQQRLAQQTEELARELERLARETSSPELQAAAQRLREAQQAMQQSAAARDQRGLGQAMAAQEALDEARRLLERDQDRQIADDVQNTIADAERALERQRGIQQATERALDQLLTEPSAARDALGELNPDREQLVRELEGLTEDLRALSRQAAETDPQAERGFREAAATISEGQLPLRADYNRRLAESIRSEGMRSQSRESEAALTQDMERMMGQLEQASAQLNGQQQDQAQELAEQARELLRGAESMEARIQQGQERSLQGQQGQQQGGQQPGQQQGGQQPGGGGGGQLDDQTIRQLRAEAGRRADQAEALRDRIGDFGSGDYRDYAWGGRFDDIVRTFRELEGGRWYATPRELAEVQTLLVESLRELDFAIRREFTTAGREGPVTSGSGAVPESYRDAVNEYFRSLAVPDR